ncbi:MAG TPA: GHKL domain-containing protein, partial [Puia sp.]|nr:GHKL domain-containing protein [Puia sp.]
IPFVENAFKHGLGLATNPYIEIRLQVRERHLRFFIANNYSLMKSSKDKSSGIGLDNVRTRLNLLYPGKYTLEISDEDGVYEVNLNMELVC